jgi:hypothetical protein
VGGGRISWCRLRSAIPTDLALGGPDESAGKIWRPFEKGSLITPLDLTFERKRILVNDFVLPSHPFIDGKTFIDCDIVGPACIYFSSNNQANPIRPPKVDAVWLEPGAKFNNGFIFTNCIFRNCSFQRITIFASVENFHAWKDLDSVNWISIPPTEADLQKRLAILKTDHAIEKSAALAKQAEAEKQAEKQVEQMMKFEPEKEQTSSWLPQHPAIQRLYE